MTGLRASVGLPRARERILHGGGEGDEVADVNRVTTLRARLSVSALLLVGVGLTASPALAKCGSPCKKLLAHEFRTCKVACPETEF